MMVTGVLPFDRQWLLSCKVSTNQLLSQKTGVGNKTLKYSLFYIILYKYYFIVLWKQKTDMIIETDREFKHITKN